MAPDCEDSTSLTLLERARRRDSEAWQRVMKYYGPLVFGWCRAARLQDDDAADVLQNVFIAVARGLENFRREAGYGTFRGWLWTITRNKIHDHFRASTARAETIGGSEGQARFHELAAEESVALSELALPAVPSILPQVIELLRGEFEQRTWQSFWRTVVEGHETAEVAASLGITVNAVRKAKCRVLKRFRQELSGLEF